MRIKFYLIIITLISAVLSSCSKGESIKDPQFGTISFINQSSETIDVVEGEDRNLSFNNTKAAINLVAGQHRFRFYKTNALLLDTLLSVDPFATHDCFIFRPSARSDLKIYDGNLNKFNAETLPDSGIVKISLANFSATFPNKVNIYITTTTYNSNRPEEIQVGAFLNISTVFSDFKLIPLGKDISSNTQNIYSIIVKDNRTNEVLATTSINLPQIEGSKTLLYNVYMIYVNGDNTAKILMGK